MIYLIIFILIAVVPTIIYKIDNKRIDLNETIENYKQYENKREKFRDWFNSQNSNNQLSKTNNKPDIFFKCKNDKLKVKNKFYYGENWKKKRGNNYEYYIMQIYKNQGYKVYPNGYLKGLNDGGIDLIAYKGQEVILVQCKNWKNGAELENITKFYNDCKKYEKQNYQRLKNKKVRKMFVISNKIQNLEIKNFLNKINNEIEFYNVSII